MYLVLSAAACPKYVLILDINLLVVKKEDFIFTIIKKFVNAMFIFQVFVITIFYYTYISPC